MRTHDPFQSSSGGNNPFGDPDDQDRGNPFAEESDNTNPFGNFDDKDDDYDDKKNPFAAT